VTFGPDPLRLIIDTDTASDDAVAVLMALMNPAVHVEALTIVAGNVPLDLAVNNALVTIETCVAAGGQSAPVYIGSAGPLARPLETAQFVHGEDGMGDVGLARATTLAAPGDAIDELIRRASDAPGELTLVTLGPLTNIARALMKDPTLLTKFRHTFMMAGAPDNVGNVNKLGEFNVWCDPEAATQVIAAPGDKTMIGWNISRLYAVMTPADQASLPDLGPLGTFVQKINRVVNEYALNTGLAGYDLPDPIAMSIAIDPTIATRTTNETLRIHIDGEHERGWSEVVPTHPGGVPLQVVWQADESRFKEQLYVACRETQPGRGTS
jgi:purine nucleosidase